MGGSGSTDRRSIRWCVGAPGARRGRCSYCRLDSARRTRRMGRRRHGPRPSRRPNHLVRTAQSRLSRCRRRALAARRPTTGPKAPRGHSTDARAALCAAECAQRCIFFFGDLLMAIRYALRVLWKSPAFTLVAFVTLMLAIGANVVVFGVLNAVLLRPLDVSDPQSLYQLRPKPWTSFKLIT